jgi:hypothetical protein
MSKPFDATLKHLVEAYPADWCRRFGRPDVQEVAVIEADVATVTAQADKVLHVKRPTSWLMQLDLQSSYDARLPRRLLQYNVLLNRRHELPVRSVVVLLRSEADGPEMTGVLRQMLPEGDCYLEFRYQVVRLWQEPVEPLLAGGLGILPLAPLGRITPEQLPGVIQRVEDRFQHEVPADEAAVLSTATFVLTGLRYSVDVTRHLFRGVETMEESSTYPWIVAQGRAKGLIERQVQQTRNLIQRQGSRRRPPHPTA